MSDPGPDDHVAAVIAAATLASGIDFARYRRATIERRIAARMAHLRCRDLADYRRRVAGDPTEARHLADVLLVRTTEAFRDEVVFDALRTELLPALVQRRRVARARRIRIWSAGTSTGEEAFSLAALGVLAAEPHGLEVDVLASDVSGVALERAARGIVPRSRLAAAPADVRARFFTETPEGAVVAPELMKRMTFSRHDLLDAERIAPHEAVVASFDLVSCRNVMIYLDAPARRELSQRLLKACSHGALLVLGTAESLPTELAELARAVPGHRGLYERTVAAAG